MIVVGGCGLSPDYDGTHFRCPPEAPTCPAGMTCVGGTCEPTGAGDGGGDARADARTDATTDVCELAAAEPDNDRCAMAIDITASATTPAGATVYGDTRGYTNDLNPSIIVNCTDAPNPGPDAIYRLTAAAGDDIMLELAPIDWDGAVYVLDACAAGATCLGGADALGTGSLDTATVSVTTAGDYFVIVDGQTTAREGCYTLRVRI